MSDNPYQAPGVSIEKTSFGLHMIAPILSCLGMLVLIVSVCHVRSDRSQSRQPIVNYVGPLSHWMPALVYVGLALSFVGFLTGVMMIRRSREDDPITPRELSAAVAMTVSIVTAIGSFVAYGFIWED